MLMSFWSCVVLFVVLDVRGKRGGKREEKGGRSESRAEAPDRCCRPLPGPRPSALTVPGRRKTGTIRPRNPADARPASGRVEAVRSGKVSRTGRRFFFVVFRWPQPPLSPPHPPSLSSLLLLLLAPGVAARAIAARSLPQNRHKLAS